MIGASNRGDHARSELRASGERSRRRVPEARDQLTAQELQIAQLAATGLSNPAGVAWVDARAGRGDQTEPEYGDVGG